MAVATIILLRFYIKTARARVRRATVLENMTPRVTTPPGATDKRVSILSFAEKFDFARMDKSTRFSLLSVRITSIVKRRRVHH